MVEKDKIKHQLKIVKGQIDGIISMIDDDKKNCSDILTQISASKKGLRRSASLILEGNIKNCIDPSINSETLDELISAFKKFL